MIMIKTKQFKLFLKAARMEPADFARKTGFNLTRLRALMENNPTSGGISLVTINNLYSTIVPYKYPCRKLIRQLQRRLGNY